MTADVKRKHKKSGPVSSEPLRESIENLILLSIPYLKSDKGLDGDIIVKFLCNRRHVVSDRAFALYEILIHQADLRVVLLNLAFNYFLDGLSRFILELLASDFALLFKLFLVKSITIEGFRAGCGNLKGNVT